MSFPIEIHTEDCSTADGPLKVSALYFDDVRVSTAAWVAGLTRVVSAEPGKLTYRHDEDGITRMQGYRHSYRCLTAEGLLSEVDYPDDPAFFASLNRVRKENTSALPHLWESFRTPVGSPQSQLVTWQILDVLLPRIWLMLWSGAVVAGTNPDMHWLYRETLKNAHQDPGKAAGQRQLRDALAANVLGLGLPNVSDLAFEQVLEVRHRQRDDLLRFRAAMSRLSVGYTDGQDWEEFVRRVYEDEVEPALADLRRHQEELRRSALLSFVGSLPSGAATAFAQAQTVGTSVGSAMTAVAVGHAVANAAIGIAAGAGVAGAAIMASTVASAVSTHLEQRRKTSELLAGSPFSIFLRVPGRAD